MNTISVEILNNKKRNYQNTINNARNEISKYEEEYDVLVKFKSIVQQSHAEFNDANVVQKELLQNLKPYYDFNSCAKIYGEEIGDFIDGVGVKLIGFAYQSLVSMIDLKMKSSYKKISDLNDKILFCKDQIEEIDEEIRIQMNS